MTKHQAPSPQERLAWKSGEVLQAVAMLLKHPDEPIRMTALRSRYREYEIEKQGLDEAMAAWRASLVRRGWSGESAGRERLREYWRKKKASA